MEVALTFAILGLGTGSIYALLAQGVVLIYRGSGVVNFGHGAVAGAGGYAFYEAFQQRGWPVIPAALLAVIVCAAIGALMQILVMRRLVTASPLARVIATTALLTVIGFSVHDTIVIYDRIRENMRTAGKRDTFDDVANRSIKETLA